MNYTVIDVREAEEYESGHIDGALNIPPTQLMNGAVELKDVPKDADLIVHCRSGSRSNVAMNILKSLGYNNVINGINKEQVNAKYNLEIK